MFVILKDDVKKLGKMGQRVKVADGYARNYLLPKALAVVADEANMKRMQVLMQSKKYQTLRIQRDGQAFAEQLRAQKLVFEMAAGENGKLFGSVTSSDIAKTLAGLGLEIDHRKIELAEPIKQLGQYTVTAKIQSDITATIAIAVEPDKASKAMHAAPAENAPEVAEPAAEAETSAE